jgi:hypothetical protein
VEGGFAAIIAFQLNEASQFRNHIEWNILPTLNPNTKPTQTP